MCACVCVCVWERVRPCGYTHTHRTIITEVVIRLIEVYVFWSMRLGVYLPRSSLRSYTPFNPFVPVGFRNDVVETLLYKRNPTGLQYQPRALSNLLLLLYPVEYKSLEHAVLQPTISS